MISWARPALNGVGGGLARGGVDVTASKTIAHNAAISHWEGLRRTFCLCLVVGALRGVMLRCVDASALFLCFPKFNAINGF